MKSHSFMAIIGVLISIFDYDEMAVQASHGQSAALLWPLKFSSHDLLSHYHCYKARHADKSDFVK